MVTQQPTRAQMEVLAQQIQSRYLHNPDLMMALLNYMGARNVRVESGQIRSTCPLHQGDRDDAFVVWFDREVPVWRCFTDCADRGLPGKLVMRKYRCSFKDALAFLARMAGMSVNLDGMIEIDQEQLDAQSFREVSVAMGLADRRPNVFPEQMVDFSMQRRHPLFVERGYPQSLLDRCQVGFVPRGVWVWPSPSEPSRWEGWFEDRISIPWRDKAGVLIGFNGRRVDGVPLRKYQTLTGTRKGCAIYGMHDPLVRQAIIQTGEICLFEGEPDVWRAMQHGIFNVGGVGGIELSPPQRSLLRSLPLKRVTVCLDGDTPGQTAATKLCEQCRQFVTEVYNAVPPADKDPGDLTNREEFVGTLRNATPFVGRSTTR